MAYTTAKSARRAARKQGLEVFEIVETEGAFNFVVPEASNENVETEVEVEAEAEVEPVAEVITYVMPEIDTTKPVAFVWAWLEANRGRDLRKNLIRALINQGYNANMVKTQTSRWFSVDGDKDAYLAIEKAKRDEEKAKIDAMVAKIQADKVEAEANEAAEAQANEIDNAGE